MDKFVEALELLAVGKNLPEDLALTGFRSMYSGEMPNSCVGAFLMGLKTKGESAVEIAAGVKAALEEARLVPDLSGDRIDTCGTGGDNTCSFNCSTAVALFLAAMGHKVVKHGNRAVSSACGSADAVEALGFDLVVEPAAVKASLDATNFVFLFAPSYHPAFKRIGPIRKELGARTLFNLMGPLLNPARPTHQILGVPTSRHVPLMAEVLALTGLRHGVVVHGAGGFDELTPFGPADVCWVRDGWLKKDRIDPAALGFTAHKPGEVVVSGRDEAIATLRGLLAGKGPAAMLDMLALNLGAALHLLENLELRPAMDKARDVVASGIAAKTFGVADA
ncbi:anthranilate phosphoribosyltransferase [Desulfolutivibrio sulfoxidireducens]|uniref:anthranilate phosphoribosyltransferase n=1 Tax=Desulfolutivibrio sulfoxidireducens TaxID=2773299 RepID=UPI00159E7F4C|nr:anthranilate phosphoribosyltransferase [Desulfolutivibrio sulfoxidireducens]QLA15224.1 anthranilate phosphoribosyltransferase [Desulfolutivibrio sulfoxidireducens]QLA18793.1 anthranilate phosphoribosyltransferase [Desulfolutivibrio sulfoxidireducens]